MRALFVNTLPDEDRRCGKAGANVTDWPSLINLNAKGTLSNLVEPSRMCLYARLA